MARATGISRRAIHVGLRELEKADSIPADRIRRPGGGRKCLTVLQPTLKDELDDLVEPTARGDPQSPLRWTCKSVRRLVAELQRQGFCIGRQKVADLLHELGYSLQGTRKTREGSAHPDRNAQFEHINAQAKAFQRAGEPVVSVDTKKKELVGDFANRGKEWQPAGEPVPVRVHDFIDKKLGKAVPYGIYDVARNEGCSPSRVPNGRVRSRRPRE